MWPYRNFRRPKGRRGTSPSTGASAPTDITLSNNTISETSADAVAANTVIGTLSASGGTAPYTFSIPAGSSQFDVSGTSLRAKSGNTLASTGSPYSVTVRVTDNNSLTYDKIFSITITDYIDLLLETVTLDNFSGASRTDPYVIFARDFEEGDVPSGSKVELRYSGSAITTQQADGRVTHADGSLKRALFMAKVGAGAVSDNSSVNVDLYRVSGSWSNTNGSIDRATVVAANDFKLRITIGSTDYWAILANMNTAGKYKEYRAGAVCKEWKFWGPLRQGTGGSDTDQGDVVVEFYLTAFEDGRTRFAAAAFNGRDSATADISVQTWELFNGATSLVSGTTKTWYAREPWFFLDANGLPYWSSNSTWFWPRTSMAYWEAKMLGFPIEDSDSIATAMSVPTPYNHSVTNFGPGWTAFNNVNAAGGNPWLGPLTQWQARALIANANTNVSAANRKSFLAYERVASIGIAKQCRAYVPQVATGYPVVLVNQDYTAQGLGSARTNTCIRDHLDNSDIRDSTSLVITQNGNEGYSDSTHKPNPFWFQWSLQGEMWWCDWACQDVVASRTHQWPSTGVTGPSRNPLLNSTQYYGSWHTQDSPRGNAWALRDLYNMAWSLPEDHPCKDYFEEAVSVSNAVGAAYFHVNVIGATQATLGWGGYNFWKPEEPGGWQGFMNSYFSMVTALAGLRGQISPSNAFITAYLETNFLGAMDQCMYHWVPTTNVWALTGGSAQTGTICDDWSEVYCVNPATGSDIKIISAADGTAGACPVSGLSPNASFYTMGHGYPMLAHRAVEAMERAGINVPSAVLTRLRAVRDAAAPSAADFAAGNNQFHIKDAA